MLCMPEEVIASYVTIVDNIGIAVVIEEVKNRYHPTRTKSQKPLKTKSVLGKNDCS